MISNLFGQFMFRFLTGIFSAVFGIMSIPSPVGRALPSAPSDFTPVVRFAVTSDVHLNGDPDQPAARKLADLLEDSYAYSDGEKYKNLDALVVVGDFATTGSDEEYKLFNSIINENKREGTELITVLGNHEFISYRDVDASVAYTHYKELINKDVDRHLTINGYHFIACSYSEDGKTFDSKKDWLTSNLDEASKATPGKPVFVFQHPHPFATVYGSVDWGDLTVRSVYEKYPQVFDFSGHSHYASSDPRCIWQGAFTAVGTGSLSALMGNLNYISGDEDAPGESGAFWICEADASGNVRLKLYDVVSHRFFEKNDYYFTDVAKRSSHLYTWNNLKSLDTAPEFPDGAKITAEKGFDGKTYLVFPNAEGYWGAEDYKITVKNGSDEVFSSTVISNYVRADETEMRVDIGEIDSDEFDVSITPYSPYAKSGKTLSGKVSVSADSGVKKQISGFGGPGFNSVFKRTAMNAGYKAFSVGSTYSDANGKAQDYSSALIAAYSASGKKIWSDVLDGGSTTSFEDVAVLADGSVIAVGETSSDTIVGDAEFKGKNTVEGIICKYTPEGKREWIKLFGGSGGDIIYAVTATDDGGFVIGGKSDSDDADLKNVAENKTKAFTAKLNEDGETEWVRALSATRQCAVYDIAVAKDGSIYATVGTVATDGDFKDLEGAENRKSYYVIVKWNRDGHVEWLKDFYESGAVVFQNICVADDGGVVIAGHYACSKNSTNTGSFKNVYNGGQAGTYDGMVIKLNPDGTTGWQTPLLGFQNDYLTGITPVRGGYAISGYTSSTNRDFGFEGKGEYDSFVYSFSYEGEAIKVIPFGGSNSDRALGIAGDEHTVVICGSTSSTDYDFEDVSIKGDGTNTLAYVCRIAD